MKNKRGDLFSFNFFDSNAILESEPLFYLFSNSIDTSNTFSLMPKMFGTPTIPAYMKVEQAEEAQSLQSSEFSHSRRSERPWYYFLQLLCKATVCLLAAYGVYTAVLNTVALTNDDLSHPEHTEPGEHHDHSEHSTELATLHDDGYVTWPDHKSCSCGPTVEAALAQGCKFDSHALAWLPPHCRDDELTKEFETLGPRPDGSWELYATRDRSQPLNFSDISMHPGTRFYMTLEWHDMVRSLHILLQPSCLFHFPFS